MSSGVVRSAFRTRLATAIAATDVSAPYLEVINKTTEPKDRPAEWVGMDFVGAEEAPISLATGPGLRRFRETGTCFVHCHAGANLTDTRSIEIADEIRDVFRDADLGSGVIVEETAPPDTGDGKPDGRTFKVIVEIRYRYDFEA